MAAPPVAVEALVQRALEYVTSRTLDATANVALGVSGFAYLDRMRVAEMNRNVSDAWATSLMAELEDMGQRQERTIITLSIDLREVATAMTDAEVAANFKATILDGQHRVAAMRKLRERFPAADLPFWVVVYLARDDADQQRIILNLNKRAPMSAADRDVMQVKQRFIAALREAVGVHDRRHPVKAVLEALPDLLADAAVLGALRGVETATLVERLQRCALDYQPLYDDTLKRTLSGATQALVRETRLFFFMRPAAEWVRHMLLGMAAAPVAAGDVKQRPRRKGAGATKGKKKKKKGEGEEGEESDGDYVVGE